MLQGVAETVADVVVGQVFREICVKGVDTSQFETKQVFYTSKDKDGNATYQVPMFIVHRKVSAVILFLSHCRLGDGSLHPFPPSSPRSYPGSTTTT